MKKLALAALLLAVVAVPAEALSTRDVLSLVAMPLATAAVSDLSGVPQNDLANVVSRLNQAEVPPPEFVQVVRYVPVALVAPAPQQPTFVQFVDTQTDQGLTGPGLVTAIRQQLSTNYGLTPVIEPDPPLSLLAVNDGYVPDTVLTRLQTSGANPLALALMPLAVAAVSNLTGVPQDQLATLAASLNQAEVPPTQFVQVMRYVPVALVDQNGNFVQFVQTQVAQGITGPALVTTISRQLPIYGVPQSEITVFSPTPLVTSRPVNPPPQIVDENYFPPVVRQRVAEFHGNPHGGPPGQLKKQLGLRTGAEVVHGTAREDRLPGYPQSAIVAAPREHGRHGHGHQQDQWITGPMISSAPEPGNGHGRHEMPPGQAKKMSAPPPMQPQIQQQPQGWMPPGQAKKQGGERGGGGGNEHGNGHGHGHGKGDR